MPCPDGGKAASIDRYLERNGAAANKAVFDIVLFILRTVDDQFDWLGAIGAGGIDGFK